VCFRCRAPALHRHQYHRITGREHKEYYRAIGPWARRFRHASHFLQRPRSARSSNCAACCPSSARAQPFDAELFVTGGLKARVSRSFPPQGHLRPKDLSTRHADGLSGQAPNAADGAPSPSSWGNKGYWEVWLDHSNSWIYSASPRRRAPHDGDARGSIKKKPASSRIAL